MSVYSYDPETNRITVSTVEYLNPLPGVNMPPQQTTIHIYDMTNDVLDNMYPLTSSNNQEFFVLSQKLVITDQLLIGLLKSKYYTTVFLPAFTSMVGDTSSMSQTIISLIVPSSNAEVVARLNPKYASQIAGNTWVNDIMRTLLIVPISPITLFYYIVNSLIGLWDRVASKV
jgi:hypothetical protein